MTKLPDPLNSDDEDAAKVAAALADAAHAGGLSEGYYREAEAALRRLFSRTIKGSHTENDQTVYEICHIPGANVITCKIGNSGADAMLKTSAAMLGRIVSGVAVLATECDGKANLLVVVSEDLAGKVHAGKIAGALAHHVDGRGGGFHDLAQACGPKAEGIDAALAAVKHEVSP